LTASSFARNGFAGGFHFLDDGFNAGAFGDEDVHVVDLVHHLLQAGGFGGKIDFHFRHEHRMDILAILREADLGEEIQFRQTFTINLGGVGGQPAAVAAHHFVDDQHARVGAVLGDHVFKIFSALFGGRPGAKALADREDVVVDGFRQTDHDQAVVIFGEEGREVGRGGIGVVAADGVKYVDAVLDELVGRDFQRVLSRLNEAALFTVLDVGQLDAAVADRAAAVLVENGRIFADLIGDGDGLALQQAFVAADIGDDFGLGGNFGVALDQASNSGGEARGQSAGGEQGNFFNGHDCSFRFKGLKMSGL